MKLDRETPITTQMGVSDSKYRAAIEEWDRAEMAVISARVALRKAEAAMDAARAAVDKACREIHGELLRKFGEA